MMPGTCRECGDARGLDFYRSFDISQRARIVAFLNFCVCSEDQCLRIVRPVTERFCRVRNHPLGKALLHIGKSAPGVRTGPRGVTGDHLVKVRNGRVEFPRFAIRACTLCEGAVLVARTFPRIVDNSRASRNSNRRIVVLASRILGARLRRCRGGTGHSQKNQRKTQLDMLHNV